MKTEKKCKHCCWPMYQLLAVAALLVALTGFVSVAEAWNIPADRSITWQGNVGVEGGIPTRTTQVDCTQAPYNVPTDGVTNARTAIVSCLNGIAAGQVAYLPAGTYVVTSSISIPSNKTLRGAGYAQTTILNKGNVSGTTGIIRFGNGYTDVTTATTSNLVSGSGYIKGSSSVTLSDASAFSVGGFVYFDELNDPNIPVTAAGGTYYGIFPGGTTRTFAVIHKITGKSGNTLTISPPAVYTFLDSLSPRAVRATPTYTQYAGVENLTIRNDSTVTDDSGNIGVEFQGAANCWASGIRVQRCGKRCIENWLDGFRNTITGNYLGGDAASGLNCITRNPSDRCYGTHTMMSSFILVENNIYHSTGEGSMLSTSVGGVFAYNYSYDVGRVNDTTWDWMSDWTHGSHNAFNLFEGNYNNGIKWDYIHGSSSHNTAFRNRLVSQPDLMSGTNAVGAIITENGNHYENEIGNVLGKAGWNNAYEVLNPGGLTYSSRPIYATGVPDGLSSDPTLFSTILRHMNFDYYTNSVKLCSDSGEPGCQGGSADTTLPPSLYLTSKPSWWGNKVWPPIGPDVPGYFVNNPAKDRFESTTVQKQPAAPPSVWIQ